MNLLTLLGVSDFAADVFPVLRVVIAIIIAILGLALIVTVLVQPSASNGVNPITGQTETFYGKNKSRTLEGLLRKLTVIFAITIAVLTVIYFVTVMIYTGYSA
jgi:preprotein translocase subunit SecG